MKEGAIAQEMIVRHLISLMVGIRTSDIDLVGQASASLAMMQLDSPASWEYVETILESVAEQIRPPETKGANNDPL